MHRLSATGIAIAALLGAEAAAQVSLPSVPGEFYHERRWIQGDKVTFCIWQVSPTMEIDRMIGEELARTLLLDVEFHEYTRTIPLTTDEFWETVFLQLAETCDAVMGFTMTTELAADWLVPTRPYYRAPFMLAVTDPAYASLGDIPHGMPVGLPLYTEADARFTEYQALQPQDRRWLRYPMTSGAQLLQFLQTGRIEGAVLWAPTVTQLVGEDPEAAGIHLVPLDPVPTPSTPIGMMLREYNVFLRNEFDQAIAALIADGVIDDLLEQANLPGSAGGD